MPDSTSITTGQHDPGLPPVPSDPKSRKGKDPTPAKEFVCIVLADMIGSTRFWADAIETQDLSLTTRAWETVCALQSAILRVMLSKGGKFIKGVGDELIFRFKTVGGGLQATESADAEIHRIHPDRPWFRFVVHWTKDGVIPGRYDLKPKSLGLRAVDKARERSTRSRGAKSQGEPDLFGHHMNYAARCLSVVADKAIYLTQDAHTKLHDPNVEDRLDWAIVIGGAKGLLTPIIFRRLKRKSETEEESESKATANAYKTKALINIGTDQADKVYARVVADVLSKRYADVTEPIRKLVPHLFIAFHTQRLLKSFSALPPDRQAEPTAKKRNGEDQPAEKRMVLRMECLEPEHLDDILLDKKVQPVLNADAALTTGVGVNTETRFIRTGGAESTKWALRGRHLDKFDYVEIQPENLNDIEEYARRLACGSVVGGEVIEVGRLWGRPSIYSIVSWNQDLSDPTRCDRCLATEARILLLDEPVAGVHPEMVSHILDLLRQLRADGKLVVFIEHDITAVRQVADLVIVMDEGKIIAQGPPGEVLERPEIMEAYLG